MFPFVVILSRTFNVPFTFNLYPYAGAPIPTFPDVYEISLTDFDHCANDILLYKVSTYFLSANLIYVGVELYNSFCIFDVSSVVNILKSDIFTVPTLDASPKLLIYDDKF